MPVPLIQAAAKAPSNPDPAALLRDFRGIDWLGLLETWGLKIVAAVATLEPEVAANIAQAAMLECISPPGSGAASRLWRMWKMRGAWETCSM